MLSFSHISFYRATLLAFGHAAGPDDVLANAGRYHKGLGVMHLKGFESGRGALDKGLVALHEVEYVYTASRVMDNRRGEPVAAGFDELVGMQARALLFPSVTPGNRTYLIDEVTASIVSVAAKVNDLSAPLYVDGPRLAVEP